jgi:putative FmdB family regulatory protein
MPTYHYICPQCGLDYEKLQKISDTTRIKCPECGTEGERQISGGAGIVFKGSGFYETDYKRAGEKKPSEKPKQEETKSASDKKPKKKDKPKTGADS